MLDVGSGAGVAVARYLAERGFAVTGLDLSPVQVALAREHVPEASFDVCDMRAVQPGAYAVDAVVSFYAIFTPCASSTRTSSARWRPASSPAVSCS